MKKLFGFLLGVVSGGLFTLFTAPRKGEEVRKDFIKTMKNKGNVSQLLLEELRGMGSEAKKTAEEINSSKVVGEYKDLAKEKFDKLYKEAKIKMKEAQIVFEEEWENLRTQVEEKELEIEDYAKGKIHDLKEKVNSLKK